MNRIIFVILAFFVLLLEVILVDLFSNKISIILLTISQILTGGFGYWIIRPYDFNTIFFVEAETQKGSVIIPELWDEVLLIFAGICLIVPGLITDVGGSILLYPSLRNWLVKNLFRAE